MTLKAHFDHFIVEVVSRLQKAGHETYVVGGAVRDAMLDRQPKDYDLSTSATPQEIRQIFGRRNTFLIGKRFQIIHLHHGKQVIEISTFRREPSKEQQEPRRNWDSTPSNLIFNDNEFGTSREDAFRRDFTVNAIFYDPVNDHLVDHTQMGLSDLENGVVRCIGDPALRFEEDPVRLLRALKLTGQYGFKLDPETEEHLNGSLPLIQHCSKSRLSLELEKILKNPYGDKILSAFQQYGFLQYYLPYISKRWDQPSGEYMARLLAKRNERLLSGFYRDSVSLAMGIITLPFVEERLNNGINGNTWTHEQGIEYDLRRIIMDIFQPWSFSKRLTASTVNMLLVQPKFHAPSKSNKLLNHPGYIHGREMLVIQNEVLWNDADILKSWPEVKRRKRPDYFKRAPKGYPRRRR